jgi:DNA-binding transcriptional MerR regulator
MAKKDQPSKLYSIAELERLSGLPRRTIHYYVKEGMIPPPEGQGRNARYYEEHRLRLALIQEMKASTHLRLKGIREIIDTMSERELQQEVERIRREKGDETGVDRLESTWEVISAGPPDDHADPGRSNLLMQMDEPEDEPDDESVDAPGPYHRLAMETPSIRGSKGLFSALRDRARMTRSDSTGMAPPEEDSISADAWNRVRVDDDVEIHYRSTGDDEFLDKIKKLVALARKLLG